MTPPIAILIPAYNESETILQVVTPLLLYSALVIIVDDGSTDNTASTLSGLPVTILKHTHNQGKGASLQTGFSYLQHQDIQGVITLDGDGQHHPDDLAIMMHAIHQHPQKLILGARHGKKERSPKYRYYANRTADFFMSWILNQPIADSQSGFRFYPKALIQLNVKSVYKRFAYESVLLLRADKYNIGMTHIDIQTLYPLNNRKSYFLPVYDSLIIAFIMLTHLLKRGFNLSHLLHLNRRTP